MQKYHSPACLPARPLPFALCKCDLYIRLFRRAAHWSAHGARGSYYLLYRVHSGYAGVMGVAARLFPYTVRCAFAHAPLIAALCVAFKGKEQLRTWNDRVR